MVRIAALTGAGISVASGLPTFAEAEWRGKQVREYLTKSFFIRHPDAFYEYFWDALEPWTSAQPNKAHLALAEAGVSVITQNIDGLHQKAGSKEVVELHGNLRELICEHCGAVEAVEHWRDRALVPRCPVDGSILKPDVVLFEEIPHNWDQAMEVILQADALLVVGTSLEVAPACYLPELARRRGIKALVLNTDAVQEVPAALMSLGARKS